MNRNIAYQTDQIARYFEQNRVTWTQFYESERFIINQLNLCQNHTVLDIGCGCGGLGLAIRDQFGVKKYTGVDINSLAVEVAQQMNPGAQILCGDFLDLHHELFRGKYFDVVFSLSCFDWNIQFSDMLAAAWEHVLPGGALVATFRLVSGEGCNDMKQSYQYINFDGAMEGECAAYVVLNANELVEKLQALDPSDISALGYFGVPSATAVTPYEKLCFSAFSIKKRTAGDRSAVLLDLNLPEDIRAGLELHL
jgi:trans-aconitate methyltransferase